LRNSSVPERAEKREILLRKFVEKSRIGVPFRARISQKKKKLGKSSFAVQGRGTRGRAGEKELIIALYDLETA